MVPHLPKSAIIGILAWYLTEHWFDYFCAPWTFDNIIKGRHVPYPLAIGICIGAVAWAWKTKEPTVFKLNCCLTLSFHLLQREAWEWPFLTNSIFICAFHVLLMKSVVRRKTELEVGQSCDAAKPRVGNHVEAARDEKGAEAPDAFPQASQGRSHAGSRPMTQALAARLPSKNAALIAALLATGATMTLHPPDLVTQYLSTINCSAHITALDGVNQHFQFTTSNKSGPFARPCSGNHQLYALAETMNAHINASSATCGVWCFRQSESGDLMGFVSQVSFGLVDMYYCRGAYQAFGPDCEAEGEEYGYDVRREGWMSDVFEPWNLIEQSQAEALD
jgi:hypothetical protein